LGRVALLRIYGRNMLVWPPYRDKVSVGKVHIPMHCILMDPRVGLHSQRLMSAEVGTHRMHAWGPEGIGDNLEQQQ